MIHMKRFTMLFVPILFGINMMAQIVLEKPISDRITGYSIDVELLTDAKQVVGTMDAYWINPSQDEVSEVQLHMYLNAFRSNKSTFYKGSGGSPGSSDIDYGWVNINEIKDGNGNDISGSMSFIQADD